MKYVVHYKYDQLKMSGMVTISEVYGPYDYDAAEEVQADIVGECGVPGSVEILQLESYFVDE